MLTVDTRKIRQFPVSFDQPQDDGTFRARTFAAQWNVFGQDDVDADRQDVHDGKLKDADIVSKYWAGWKEGDIKLSDGTVLENTIENRQLVLSQEGMRGAIVRAWLKLVAGAGK